MLDLEGGRLTQMAHHGITKLEIDFLWTAIDTDNFHQQPLPSIGCKLVHAASKEVPCVLCNVYIVQTN